MRGVYQRRLCAAPHPGRLRVAHLPHWPRVLPRAFARPAGIETNQLTPTNEDARRMTSPLELTLLLLLCSVVGVVVFRFFNLPPMLGYLAVGIVVGPHAAGIAPDTDRAQHLAEFGVVFLMFSIGLEFSLSKLRSMRRIVFGLGACQVIGTILIALLVGWIANFWIGMAWEASIALGGALSMSSTAIVSKMLAERLELESEHGRNIFGVLLFQDLAVVPLLIIIAAFGNGNSSELAFWLAVAAAKIVVALTVLLFIGQKFMTRWFNLVARRRSQELFMLNLLLVTLGAAFITDKFGLSLALGAFIAGMLIAETPYPKRRIGIRWRKTSSRSATSCSACFSSPRGCC
jgi:CPA2 family monovalent cation:H+ antiporter-2